MENHPFHRKINNSSQSVDKPDLRGCRPSGPRSRAAEEARVARHQLLRLRLERGDARRELLAYLQGPYYILRVVGFTRMVSTTYKLAC